MKEKYKIQQKAYYEKNKVKNGLTLEKLSQLLKNQRNTCKICHKKPTRDLIVDHCHKTKKVRGLLCYRCNTGIGQFNDDPIMLKRAIEYLLGGS